MQGKFKDNEIYYKNYTMVVKIRYINMSNLKYDLYEYSMVKTRETVEKHSSTLQVIDFR